MFVIQIPKKSNKLLFVTAFLNNVIKEFNEYTFVNCTSSPLDNYSYVEWQKKFYRIMTDASPILPCADKHLEGYKNDNLERQGISIDSYLEAIALFELERILVGSGPIDDFGNIFALVNIYICPDGLNEIHILGKNELCTSIVDYLKYSGLKLVHKRG